MQTSSNFVRTLGFLAGLSIGAATLTCPSAVFAQPGGKTQQDAKDHFIKGVDLFQEADFQGSLIEFKRSYELVPKYDVLYNIGEVYFQMQDYANALRTLQQFLDQGGARIPASKKTQVEKDVEKLKGRVATLLINVSVSGAEVFVDDAPIGISPLRDPILVSAGKRRFMATKDGFNAVRETKDLAGADRSELTLTLTPLQPGQVQQPLPQQQLPTQNTPRWQVNQPPLIPPPDNRPSLVGPILAFSITGAAAVGWGLAGGLALSASSDLGKLKQEATTQAALTEKANQAKTSALVSDIMMGVTIAGGATATVLTIVVVNRRNKPDTRAASLDLKVGPANAFLSGQF